MATGSMKTVIQHLCKSLRLHEDVPLSDAQLLKQFIDHRDESAFATLVHRHGPLVMGVCRRVAQDPHDAEDAFQATFLILVRKAASIARRELLANWLYGVAQHSALKARAATMKRRAREKQVAAVPEPAAAEPDALSEELQAILDRELSRLPEKYRVPVILCDLEGKTRKQAAQLVGCPEGSLHSRLARARAMLAKRLARHGVAISAGSLAVGLAQGAASAHVPPPVLSCTIKSAGLIAAGAAAASGISPKVTALMEGVLKAMLLTKLKSAMLVVVVGLMILGATGSAYQALTAECPESNEPVQQPAPARADKEAAPPKGSLATAKKEREQLLGDWQLVACTEDGLDVPPDLVKQVQIRFQGDRIRFTPAIEFHETQVEGEQQKRVEIKLGDGDFEALFQLDAASKPSHINFVLPEDIERREVVRGIYTLQGGRLTICLRAGDRPTDFTCKPGSQRVLYIMERKTPRAEPPGKKARADEKALEGAWQVVSAERHGMTWKYIDGDFVLQDPKPMAFPISPQLPERVVFSGEQCTLEYPDGPDRDIVVKDRFALDAQRMPKWITLTAPDGDMTYGIYSAGKDEVRLCWQLGRRRNLRPTDFKTKPLEPGPAIGEDDTELWVLRRPVPEEDRKPAEKDLSGPVPIRRLWDGVLANRNLVKESPEKGVVVDAEAWVKMWKAWRGKEPVPAIDFDKQLAIILTVPGANKITAPELRLDRDGNLKVPLPVSTLLPDDGRVGYMILLINRAGVNSVNGRSIVSAPPGAY